MRIQLGIFIAISLLILSSCSENESKQKLDDLECFSINFEVNDDMLVFPSPVEFENLLDTLAVLGYDYFIEWDKNTNFKSLRSYYYDNGVIDELIIEDELLAVLLNENSQIMIGTYIFKLFPESEQVQVVNTCSDLKSSELFSFSFDDEIIPYLFEGETAKSATSCETPKGVNRYYSWDCWGEEIQIQARYYKAGIYNSIYIEMKLTNCITPGVKFNVYTSATSQCTYDNCNSDRTLLFGETKYACKIYHNLYRKIQRVNECNLEVNYEATQGGDPTCNNSAYLEIKF